MFKDKNSIIIKRGCEVEYNNKKWFVEDRIDGIKLRTYNFEDSYVEHYLKDIDTQKECVVTDKNPLSSRCIMCEKLLNPEDRVYVDSYFGQTNCSWECAVEYMADFFGLEEGYTTKLKDID